MTGTAEWESLSESARAVLVDVACKLAKGFTGEIRLECSQGGIRNITTTQIQRPPDLAQTKEKP